MNTEGFCDLRPDRHLGLPRTEESFWPSFTDLMMVVVMIFLLTTSMLALRNWHLVEEMSGLIDAEKKARESAQKSADDKGYQLAEIAQAQLARDSLAQALSDTEESLRVVTQMRDATLSRATRQAERLAALRQDNQRLQTALQAQRTQSEEQLASQTLKAQQSLQDLQREQNETAEALEILQAEHSRLQGKYDNLLRPARSTQGKVVVSVRHGRSQQALFYDIQKPGENQYTRVSEAALHAQLQQQLETLGDTLYLKLIYPRQSGLSYDEAYSFRNSVLNRYDYYYRKQPLNDSPPQ